MLWETKYIGEKSIGFRIRVFIGLAKCMLGNGGEERQEH